MTVEADIDTGEDEGVGATRDPADAQAARENDAAARIMDRVLLDMQ